MMATAPRNNRKGARVRHHAITITRANERRIALGLTVRQLAERCRLNASTITRCLHDDIACDIRTYRIVAAALDDDPFRLWKHLAKHPRVLVVQGTPDTGGRNRDT